MVGSSNLSGRASQNKMPDVFLSYAREDQSTARRIAESLERAGYSVWWDQTLSPGEAYDEVTEKALESARAVVVLWSRQSVGSRWVRAEATQAERSGTLLPALIEPCKLPIMFELRQTADLTGWNGDIAHPVWQSLLGGVGRLVKRAPVAPVQVPAPAAAQAGPSLVVLPFQNLSADPEQEFFADGVVEAITATLSRVRSFFVISRNTAFRYKGRALNVPEVARELGVRYVVEGSVQKSGNRVRITVQLVDAIEDAHVWADRVDGTLEDVFELQDRITERVAGALQPSIRLAEIERARRKPPQDLGAYDYTMRAMPHVWALEKDASARALELLGQALAIDPEYPLALALAGWCHAQQQVYNWTSDFEGARVAALEHANKAVRLAGDDPLILAVLGAVQTIARNMGAARAMLEKALSLDPNSAWAWSRLGWVEIYADQPARALENFERALRLSPLDPMNFNNYVGIGIAHDLAGRFDESVIYLRRAMEERPGALWVLRALVPALVGAGRLEEAKAECARLLAAQPESSITLFRRGLVANNAVLDRWTPSWRAAGFPD